MPSDGKRATSITDRRTFLRSVTAASTLSVAGLAGCSSQAGDGDGGNPDGGSGEGVATTGSSGGSNEQVNVGFLTPQSGPLSPTGPPMVRGAEIAVTHINEELGGVNGRTVNGIVEDTQTDPATGQERARKLVEQNNVDVLIGATSGAVSASVAQYAYKAGVPYFPYGGSESTTGENCAPTTFRYSFSTSQDARAGALWALDKFGSNAWIHHADYSFGQSVRDSWRTELEESSESANIVNVTSSPLGTEDFSSYISQIQSSDIDWVLAVVTGSDATSFLSQAEQFGLKSEVGIIGSGTFSQQPLRQGAGSAAVGVYDLFRYYYRYDLPANETFVQRFLNEYDIPPTSHADNSWTGLHMFAKAANAAGSTEAADVIAELEGMEYDSPTGPVTLRDCDHQAVRDYLIGKIVEPGDYDFPDLSIEQTRPGEDITEPCAETGCEMPSL